MSCMYMLADPKDVADVPSVTLGSTSKLAVVFTRGITDALQPGDKAANQGWLLCELSMGRIKVVLTLAGILELVRPNRMVSSRSSRWRNHLPWTHGHFGHHLEHTPLLELSRGYP